MKQKNTLRSLRLPLALIFVLSFVIANCGTPDNLGVERQSLRLQIKSNLKYPFYTTQRTRTTSRLKAPTSTPRYCICCPSKTSDVSACGLTGCNSQGHHACKKHLSGIFGRCDKGCTLVNSEAHGGAVMCSCGGG